MPERTIHSTHTITIKEVLAIFNIKGKVLSVGFNPLQKYKHVEDKILIIKTTDKKQFNKKVKVKVN